MPSTKKVPRLQASPGQNWSHGRGGALAALGAPYWRATSPCKSRRVAGCTSKGPPACRRRSSAEACSSFSIGRSGSDILQVIYYLDGKAAGFPEENTPRAMLSSRSRHLLKRELTVFGFSFSSVLSSS